MPESAKTTEASRRDFPYPDYVKSDPVLKSIFDRIRTSQHFRFSEFTHFIAPLVQDFEAAAVDFLDEQGCVLPAKNQIVSAAFTELWEKHADLIDAVVLMLQPMLGTIFAKALDALGPAKSPRREYFFKYYDEYVPRFKDSDPFHVVDFATDMHIFTIQALVSSLFYCARPHLTLKQSGQKVRMWHYHHVHVHLMGKVLRHVTACIMKALMLKVAAVNPQELVKRHGTLSEYPDGENDLIAVIKFWKGYESLSADDRDMLDVLVSLHTCWLETQRKNWELLGYVPTPERGQKEFSWLLASVEKSVPGILLKRARLASKDSCPSMTPEEVIEQAVRTYDASKEAKLSTWARYQLGLSMKRPSYEKDGYRVMSMAAETAEVHVSTIKRYIKRGLLKPKTYEEVYGKQFWSQRLGRKVKLYLFSERDIDRIRELKGSRPGPFLGYLGLKDVIDALFRECDLDLAQFKESALGQYVRRLEKKGVIKPRRSAGRIRYYSTSDYKRVKEALSRRYGC